MKITKITKSTINKIVLESVNKILKENSLEEFDEIIMDVLGWDRSKLIKWLKMQAKHYKENNFTITRKEFSEEFADELEEIAYDEDGTELNNPDKFREDIREGLLSLAIKCGFEFQDDFKLLGSLGSNVKEQRYWQNITTKKFYREPHPEIQDVPSKDLIEISINDVPPKFHSKIKR